MEGRSEDRVIRKMVAKPVIYINTDYFLLNNFAYRKKVVIILEYAFNLR